MDVARRAVQRVDHRCQRSDAGARDVPALLGVRRGAAGRAEALARPHVSRRCASGKGVCLRADRRCSTKAALLSERHHRRAQHQGARHNPIPVLRVSRTVHRVRRPSRVSNQRGDRNGRGDSGDSDRRRGLRALLWAASDAARQYGACHDLLGHPVCLLSAARRAVPSRAVLDWHVDRGAHDGVGPDQHQPLHPLLHTVHG